MELFLPLFFSSAIELEKQNSFWWSKPGSPVPESGEQPQQAFLMI